MDARHKMRANRNKDRDNQIVETLRAYDAPMTAAEVQELLPNVEHVSSHITPIAMKYPYPVWRLRGTKAGSTSTKYVYSDTQPFNAVRKFPEFGPSVGTLQYFLDLDLTEDANRKAREARKAAVPEKVVAAAPVLPGIVAAAVEKSQPAFELLEERDDDVILFKFKGRVFFGKPVRI